MRLLRGAADAQCVKARCPDFPLWSLRIVRPEHDSAPTVSSEGAGAEKGEKAVVRSKVNRRHRLSLEDQLKGVRAALRSLSEGRDCGPFRCLSGSSQAGRRCRRPPTLGRCRFAGKTEHVRQKCRGLNGLFRSQTVCQFGSPCMEARVPFCKLTPMTRFELLELLNQQNCAISCAEISGLLKVPDRHTRSFCSSLATRLRRLYRWGLVRRQRLRSRYLWRISERGRERLAWAKSRGLVRRY